MRATSLESYSLIFGDIKFDAIEPKIEHPNLGASPNSSEAARATVTL